VAERIWLVSYAVAGLLVTAQGLALLALLWALGRVHLRSAPEAQALITDEGPDIHEAMPPVQGLDTSGRWICSNVYRGRELVLLLLSPDCAPCERLLHDIRAISAPCDTGPAFLAVLEMPASEAKRTMRRHRLRFPVIVDENATLRTALGVGHTPYAFLVDAAGVLRMKGVVNNRTHLEGLIDRRGEFLGDDIWQAREDVANMAQAQTR
jgi:methylamine dehydrogenase accessory protein MauD